MEANLYNAHWSEAKEQGNSVQIQVSDNGIVIPMTSDNTSLAALSA